MESESKKRELAQRSLCQ